MRLLANYINDLQFCDDCHFLTTDQVYNTLSPAEEGIVSSWLRGETLSNPTIDRLI